MLKSIKMEKKIVNFASICASLINTAVLAVFSVGSGLELFLSHSGTLPLPSSVVGRGALLLPRPRVRSWGLSSSAYEVGCVSGFSPLTQRPAAGPKLLIPLRRCYRGLPPTPEGARRRFRKGL
ncbi:hypothetical protein AAFF_G00374260 [Aldrovandia affinis]|uniref:Uncharacterized protein n=1 Tax=Aldrovandia affinis TaxID=143900 RepID=A0AAD7SG54_9TELE|nr:hypothetical protein AAFF_G00374260 [Aldrovandia affinis]